METPAVNELPNKPTFPRIIIHQRKQISWFNPSALIKANTLRSYGRSESKRVKHKRKAVYRQRRLDKLCN